MLATVNRALWVLNLGLILIILLTITFGCAPARSAADSETCRIAADERLRVKAIEVCPAGDAGFEECPEYDAMIAAYRKDLVQCR